ncbi:predicted protein [Arabidopsis lyrata subsp. lyrata]|uniref:Predicted protein n=1 Tax=Arabidopsis lyrata subsp. lyrata TaxID=81972 RepID=D7MG06_ARALL|nr:uncharacterized protein LOC9303683 [Arabidopsis lyrata subsp. lyrata]EFH45930.1 predicted protein [Arabidopsis lyrata subsp. lyrata]|eukprot:XP_002869671.1 uncharacterized protein LOC9303683 [Arabidopsis lyrata subsp. lyrata]
MGRECSKCKKKSNEANGCVTALYYFFHFHQFYFPSRHHHHQPSSVDSNSRTPKGLVAPRNSLDLTEESPLSTNYKLENESLNIHVGRKNSTLRALLVDTYSNNCSSPRTKSPNVVARLMGLDLLPDNLDLNRSSKYSVRGHRLSGNGSGTRSLPASPRISSDSENCRLTLQLNREKNKHEEFGRRRLKELKHDEQSPRPKHNGRQIKESVTTRKFGMDITNLLENKRAGAAAQNRIEHSRFSQKENTTSTNPTIVLRQDHISQQPKKVTLSKDFKDNLNRANEQPLRPGNGWKKTESEAKVSPHPTPPNNRNKQRSTPSKSSDCCDLIEKKQCKKISVASSAFSATERPRKQIKRAEEQERKSDATICSGQMYKYEKKLPQEPPSSKFYDSTTITVTLANVRDTKKDISGTKKLEEEEEWVVAEIERQIVDALVQETVETTSFTGLNARAVRFERTFGYIKTASAF